MSNRTACSRFREVMSNLPLLAVYFRDSPRVTFRCFIKGPLVHALVCSWRGHSRSGTVHRILGMCDRCGEMNLGAA